MRPDPLRPLKGELMVVEIEAKGNWKIEAKLKRKKKMKVKFFKK